MCLIPRALTVTSSWCWFEEAREGSLGCRTGRGETRRGEQDGRVRVSLQVSLKYQVEGLPGEREE